jgi:hypothetical protein
LTFSSNQYSWNTAHFTLCNYQYSWNTDHLYWLL